MMKTFMNKEGNEHELTSAILLLTGHSRYFGCYAYDSTFVYNNTEGKMQQLTSVNNDPMETCREYCKGKHTTYAGYIFYLFLLEHKSIVFINLYI